MFYDAESNKLMDVDDSESDPTGLELGICARLFQSGRRAEAATLWRLISTKQADGKPQAMETKTEASSTKASMKRNRG